MNRFPNRLVLATHNAKKAGEMRQVLLAHFPDLIVQTLADFPGAPEPEETADDYEGNALIKARSAVEATGQWALADDAGLEVKALGGAPGVKSKRFEGEDSPFPVKMARMLEMLSGVEGVDRAARFVCSIVLCSPTGDTYHFQATCEGKISMAPKGENGFGYDPIFELPDGRTMAQLTSEQKHAVSHRGKVIRQLVAWASE